MRQDHAFGGPARERRPAAKPSSLDGLFGRLQGPLRIVIDRPVHALGATALLVGIGIFLTAQLRVDSDFSRLIPPSYPSVQAFERLQNSYGGESEVAVVIESPSFEANKAFAEALIEKAAALKGAGRSEPYFTHVEYRRDVAFLEDNALYFATSAELDSLEDFLNREIRDARLEANPFYFDLEEEDEDNADADRLLDAHESIIGKEYPISDDSTVMAVRFFPSGAQTDIAFIEDVYSDLQLVVDSLRPSSFHPDMEITLAGRLYRQLVQVRAILNDVRSSFGAGVLLLLLMVTAYFSYKNYLAARGRHLSVRAVVVEIARAPLAALLIAVPLLASEAVTFGIAFLAFGSLNIMTAALGLMLFGMGIDFGIHFFARYAEERATGKSLHVALADTFQTTGQAIAVVAITTAASFYVLMVADFRGFSQFGFIAGTGIILAVVSTLVLMPALLAVFERWGWMSYPGGGPPSPALLATSRRLPTPVFFIGVSVAALVGAFLMLPRVSFEYDFSNLEPDYEEYNVRQRKARQVYSDRSTRNAAYVLVDDPAEAPAVAAAVRRKIAADSLSPTIRDVESLDDRFPMDPAARRIRIERIAHIRDLLSDPFLEASKSEDLRRLERAAGTREPIEVEALPTFLRERFILKSGEIGHLVIIYPSVSLAHGRTSMEFADDAGRIETADGRVYYAASTSIVASDMLRLMIAEAPIMVALTLLLVVVFKWIVLRRILWVAFAFLPLAVSFCWLFGLMGLVGWKLNFYNLVVLPTVLGIGDDSTIHIVHRYLEEGAGSVRRVLRSTGEHVTVSALTTMVGFGGLILSMHPGMRSIGWLAAAGIAMTLISSLVLLPALLQWRENRKYRHRRACVEPETWRSTDGKAPSLFTN